MSHSVCSVLCITANMPQLTPPHPLSWARSRENKSSKLRTTARVIREVTVTNSPIIIIYLDQDNVDTETRDYAVGT